MITFPPIDWQDPIVDVTGVATPAFQRLWESLNNLATIAGNQNGGGGSTTSGSAFTNRLINGAMLFDQRNGGNVVVQSTTLTPAIDRWKGRKGTAGTATLQQSTGGPNTNFSNCLIWTTGTAGGVPTSGDSSIIEQDIEAYNFSDALWGTASAQTIALSFWVQASIPGIYAGSIQNSARTRSYVFQFPVTFASSWQYITIIIPGDTAGTWLNTTGVGARLVYDMGSGSNFEAPVSGSWNGANYTRIPGAGKPMSTASANIEFTGVQLEIGSTASPFQARSVTDELVLCQRYFQIIRNEMQFYSPTSNQYRQVVPLPVVMRITPVNTVLVSGTATNITASNAVPINSAYYYTTVTSGTSGNCNLTGQIVSMDAELV